MGLFGGQTTPITRTITCIHLVSFATKAKEICKAPDLANYVIRFVSLTEKRERSNARAQTQQCDHGIEVVGAKQSK